MYDDFLKTTCLPLIFGQWFLCKVFSELNLESSSISNVKCLVPFYFESICSSVIVQERLHYDKNLNHLPVLR